MPSFTRRVPARPGPSRTVAPEASGGPQPASSSNPSVQPTPASKLTTVSTGIGSLDDVLGSYPPGSVLLLLNPDPHTAWGRIVARHIASQGLLEGGKVVVLANEDWVKGMVWTAEDKESVGKEDEAEVKEEGNDANERGYADRRIAWRYDSLSFQTTVGTTSLDASKTIPAGVRARAEAEGRLVRIDMDEGLSALAKLAAELGDTRGTTRVAVDISPDQEYTLPGLTRFLLSLRATLRPHDAVAVVTLPPRLSRPSPEGLHTLAYAADATIELSGFGTNPLASAYAPAHGLLTPHRLSARGHILAPALRHSSLLGVNAGSEQNLGFRLKRRRWVVETVHLGIEGGSGERRTEPVARKVEKVPEVTAGVEGVEKVEKGDKVGSVGGAEGVETAKPEKKKPRAKVRFGEDVVVSHDTGSSGHDHHSHDHTDHHSHASSAPRVAIRHDRPDLYEF